MITLQLKNAYLGHHNINVDVRIRKKISINTTTQVNDKLCDLFTFAFQILADQILYEGMREIQQSVCILTDSDEVSVILEPAQQGSCLRLCIYPVSKWLANGYSDLQIMVNIVEEFAHMFWMIVDEIEVCYKVLEIMKRVGNKYRIEDLYSEEWLRNNGVIK